MPGPGSGLSAAKLTTTARSDGSPQVLSKATRSTAMRESPVIPTGSA